MRSSLLLLFLPAITQALPLSFEPNRGQAAPEVRFLASGIFFTRREAVLVFPSDEALRIRPEGAAPSMPDGLEPLPGKSNYLNREPAITGVPHYGRIRYRSVYPGIDLVYYGRGNGLEYDFAVAAGARPERIRLTFRGARELRIDANGDLVARLRNATFVQRQPRAWQSGADGVRRRIAIHYVFTSKTEVAFAIGGYDRTRPLTIDPLIDYATYLGAANGNPLLGSSAYPVAVDSAGSAYITGAALPGQFPATTGTVPSSSSNTGFVAKLSADGTQLIYSTFLNLPAGQAIAVDSQGSAYVAGSAGTPAAAVGYIVKLTPDGSALAYSYDFSAASFLCCSPVSQLVLDSARNAYVLGSTSNYKFPTSPGSYQSAFPGQINILGVSATYGFVIKLNGAGSLAYSTYLRVPFAINGTATQALAVDGNQDAIVLSIVQPSVAGQLPQSTLVKLNPSGSAAVSTMTFPNGASPPILAIQSIATNSAGTLYAAGFGSLSSNSTGNFVAQLNSSGSVANGRYIPNSGNVYVDGSGNSYVVGTLPGGGGFVTRVDSSFSTVTTSSLLSPQSTDEISAAAVDSAGNLYLTLFSTYIGQSPQFPATPGAYRTTGGALAVVKMDASSLATVPPPIPPTMPFQMPLIFPGGVTNAASGLAGPIAPGEILTVYGANLGPAQLVSAAVNANGQLPTNLAGTSLLVGGVPVPLLYSSAGQIAGIVPLSLNAGGGPVVVQAEYQGMASPLPPPSAVAAAFPGLFTSDASGHGQGAILNQNGSVNSASNPAAPGTVVSLFCNGCGATTPPGIDGALATSLAPLANPFMVTIGGQTAQVLYAGSAPGLLNGPVQINVTVPAGISGDAVPVSVSVSGSPPIGPAVTLAVR